MEFEVYTVVKICIVDHLDLASCGLAGDYKITSTTGEHTVIVLTITAANFDMNIISISNVL
jgi:hypothetical protein